MLFAGKSKGGKQLVPRWFALLFGGTYRQRGAGYGWRPSAWRLICRYYKEGWYKHSRTGLWNFVTKMP